MTRSELTRRLLREAAILQDLTRQALEPALGDLPRNQYFVLNHLVFTSNRNESPGDLARLFFVTPAAMTQTLKRMAQAGLVELQAASHDARAKVVVLTATGRARHEQVASRISAHTDAVARQLPKADLEALLPAMRRFRDAVETTVRTTHTEEAQP